ncbi:uncharacterized protein LOC134531383 [Bacillus rossius redtenbacheri]|uniref:uncharacterized protein LOC134531383 n=1 Tax=Bacillus rossius redtenbacheri TaxID=93214 RepID=UPI002FDE6FBF
MSPRRLRRWRRWRFALSPRRVRCEQSGNMTSHSESPSPSTAARRLSNMAAAVAWERAILPPSQLMPNLEGQVEARARVGQQGLPLGVSAGPRGRTAQALVEARGQHFPQDLPRHVAAAQLLPRGRRSESRKN